MSNDRVLIEVHAYNVQTVPLAQHDEVHVSDRPCGPGPLAPKLVWRYSAAPDVAQLLLISPDSTYIAMWWISPEWRNLPIPVDAARAGIHSIRARLLVQGRRP